MKPTQDIIEELRDAMEQTTDPRCARLLTDAADRIEHLFASGIHTCHADCQRPMCVLRRERDKALADLARVTAELEHHKSVKETIDSAHKELSREHAALRARVAEVDEQAERYRLVTLRQDATIAELTTDGNAATLAANLAIVSKRNAELVAALRDAVGMLEELDGLDWGEEGMPFAVDFDHFAKLLARAESVAPDHIPDAAKMAMRTQAKHPDTDIVDWMEQNPQAHLAEVRRLIFTDRYTVREAVREARKQGGAT